MIPAVAKCAATSAATADCVAAEDAANTIFTARTAMIAVVTNP